MKKIFYSLVALSLLISPVIAFAQLGSTPAIEVPGNLVPQRNLNDLFGSIDNIANVMLAILIALAVVFIVYAAFLYLFSAGDDKKLGTAKNYIIYALVAVAVGILAKGLVAVIRGIVIQQNF